ncbi:MAG: sulfate ABC transporter substrate-binding protein [Actinobacteria bacterium]|nr:sulfate ABC transporter substrate-binding protein [Actinomycetota bacterium]
MRRTRVVPIAIALSALLLAAGCGSSSKSSTSSTSSSGGAAAGGGKIALVAYSTPKEAYAQLIPAFQRTPLGRGVQFTQSYGASGDQSRAVDGGLHADVVEFSLEPDVTRLVKDGIVPSTWNAGPTRGIVTRSVVVLAVRKGNPKHITGWNDLVKPGVKIVTPNPFTSGGARWNIMAAYGSQIAQGRSPAQAQAFLASLFKNVAVQDKSARDALQTFSGGKGDVLISYENEAIAAQQKHVALQYIVPKQTILIENPVAVTKNASKPAQAFVSYLYTPAAQAIFARNGYRPVVMGVTGPYKFPKPSGLFTIQKFGGWTVVSKRFFDPQTGIVAGIERKLGVSTASG